MVQRLFIGRTHTDILKKQVWLEAETKIHGEQAKAAAEKFRHDAERAAIDNGNIVRAAGTICDQGLSANLRTTQAAQVLVHCYDLRDQQVETIKNPKLRELGHTHIEKSAALTIAEMEYVTAVTHFDQTKGVS